MSQEVSMVCKFPILHIGGLAINGTPLAGLCSLLLWAALAFVALFAFRLPPVTAVWGGLVAMLLHWLSELLHQLLAISRYPQDEPQLGRTAHQTGFGRSAGQHFVGTVGAGSSLALVGFRRRLVSTGALFWSGEFTSLWHRRVCPARLYRRQYAADLVAERSG
jgi:hypothetical protein